MGKNIYWIAVFLLAFVSCSEGQKEDSTQANAQKTEREYVNHFIGTGAHGHTYPGATTPFGMVQLSPDNGTQGWDWVSGYHYSDSVVVGFSHLHLSGTGIGDLADISVMPVNAKPNILDAYSGRDNCPWKSSYVHSEEEAHPGYYSVNLKDANILAELTATPRTGVHKYSFAKGDEQGIILDLNFALNWDGPVDTQINVEGPNTISGYRKSSGWAKEQHVYFVAEFNKPIKEHELSLVGEKLSSENTIEGKGTRAWFGFAAEGGETLELTMAISSTSIEGARKNLEAERKADFAEAQAAAAKLWSEHLGAIKVYSDNEEQKEIFYSALYHTMVAPDLHSDVDGKYRGADQKVHGPVDFNYYSTLSLWDIFRTWAPLHSIIEPELTSDMVNTMLNHFDEYGQLPVWALSANETFCMTGNHAIPIIVEAYQKGIRGFDAEKALEAMKVTMNKDIRALDLYKKYGYVPFDKADEGVSITTEYAYNDYCIAVLARELGKDEDYQFYLDRSKGYQAMFDNETGFFRGLSADGKSYREPFDPRESKHRVDTDYTESNAWQSSWFVLQDVPNLIAMHGGKEAFGNKLDALFAESSLIEGEHSSPDISGLIGQYAHGNEPSHHIAYLYNYADQAWKTQEHVREIMDSLYTTAPDGIPGNEDCGQMSAWYVMSAMGIYPVNPVAAEYQFGSPLFDKVEISLKDDKKITILAQGSSSDKAYVKNVYWNDKLVEGTSISHLELIQGGVLKFEMSSTPNKN